MAGIMPDQHRPGALTAIWCTRALACHRSGLVPRCCSGKHLARLESLRYDMPHCLRLRAKLFRRLLSVAHKTISCCRCCSVVFAAARLIVLHHRWQLRNCYSSAGTIRLKTLVMNTADLSSLTVMYLPSVHPGHPDAELIAGAAFPDTTR